MLRESRQKDINGGPLAGHRRNRRLDGRLPGAAVSDLLRLPMADTPVTNGDPAARAAAARFGRRLEYLSLGWNVIEAAVALGAAAAAGSIALTGFGVDSVIEGISGGVLLWRLQTHRADEERERRARRLVGLSFLLLAAYIAFEAAATLLRHEPPRASIPGMVLSAASLAVMPLLARAKRRVAARLQSGALQADSRQTDLCAWLSGIVLGGLALNTLFGWWWADPVAGLLMVPIIVREGVGALHGRPCADGC
jgi:divalent metal cation (Fe/Co/Zn/Cd) transporter